MDICLTDKRLTWAVISLASKRLANMGIYV